MTTPGSFPSPTDSNPPHDEVFSLVPSPTKISHWEVSSSLPISSFDGIVDGMVELVCSDVSDSESGFDS